MKRGGDGQPESVERGEFVGSCFNNMFRSLEGRFDLANNASHSLALAALRWHGYRAD